MTPYNRVILSARNMVEKLPRFCLDNGPMETELITRYLDAALSPLFEDLDNEIIFRRTSVTDDKNPGDEQPDAVISVTNGASFKKTIAYGEVKPEGAIDSNNTKLSFSFLVVGNHATFYLMTRQAATLYTMAEVGYIMLPLSLEEIPLYLAQANIVTNVIIAFENVIASPAHEFGEFSPSLSAKQVNCVIDYTVDRKRKSITSHYRQ
ncbi:unnamed protein product [Mucor hiemalis]